MKMLRAPLILVMFLLLSSCTLTVQPGAAIEVQTVGVSSGQFVNERLGVRSYPGAVLVKQEEDRSSSKTTFETGASLEAVHAHFHNQLAARGWRRFELESKRHEVEAEYGRNGEELELKLKREGQSGRYRLELELDD